MIKSFSTVLGLLVGIAIAAGTGYFQGNKITAAPAATFFFVHRFPLAVRGELVLPFLASYLVVISEALANITATCSASQLPIEGPTYGKALQGGLLSDTLLSLLAGLFTVSPSTTFRCVPLDFSYQNILLIPSHPQSKRLRHCALEQRLSCVRLRLRFPPYNHGRVFQGASTSSPFLSSSSSLQQRFLLPSPLFFLLFLSLPLLPY
jgi:hypothetical protein